MQKKAARIVLPTPSRRSAGCAGCLLSKESALRTALVTLKIRHTASPVYLGRHKHPIVTHSICWLNLAGELSWPGVVSVIWRLLSGAQFLQQYSKPLADCFKCGLKTHLFHLAYNSRDDLTCAATASEVTILWQDLISHTSYLRGGPMPSAEAT